MNGQLSKYFDKNIRPSVEKLEKTLGTRKTITVEQEPQTIELQNNPFYDKEIARDGRKHYVYIPF